MTLPGLESLLETVRRRHTQTAFTLWAFWVFITSVCAVTAVRTTLFLFWQDPSWLVNAVVFALCATAVAWYIYPRALSRIEAARLIDERLALKDRLATAVEFKNDSSQVLHWLLKDAEQQVRFVDPREIVPFPPPWRRQELTALALLALAVVVWIAPLPSGLLIATEQAATSTTDVGTESELIRRIAALRERAMSLQSAQMRRIGEDTEAIQAGLRDRSLRAEEASALLDHLERRLRAAEQQSASTPPTNSESPLDLERLQEISDRLTNASGGLREVRVEAERVARVALQLQEAVDGADDMTEMRPSATVETESESNSPADSSEASDSGSQDVPSAGASSAQGGASESASAREERAADTSGSGGQDSSGSTGSRGAGDQPAQTEGNDANPETPAERPEGIRVVVGLPGVTGAGPMRATSVPTSYSPPDMPESGGDPGPLAPSGETTASAVVRESIPLEYREVVRRYFQSLESAP